MHNDTQQPAAGSQSPAVHVFCSNKGGSGKTLFSLVSIIHGVASGKRVAAVDLNFENPDTATILHGIVEGNRVDEAPVINEGTPLAYREEKIMDGLHAIRPHPLYHKDYHVFTFLDQFLYANKGRFDVVIVDTGLNLPNLMPGTLQGERWPRSRAMPTIWQLYSYSSGLRPWEMQAFDESIAAFKTFFHDRFDTENLVHVFNPQAFIPNALGAGIKYAARARFQFEGADQVIKQMRKLGKRGGQYEAIPWDAFKTSMLLGIRSEFWKVPLGEYWKDEIPTIFLEVANRFIKTRKTIPTNIFFHPYVYHRVQMLVDDLIVRRGKDLTTIKDMVQEVYDNYVDFLAIREAGAVQATPAGATPLPA